MSRNRKTLVLSFESANWVLKYSSFFSVENTIKILSFNEGKHLSTQENRIDYAFSKLRNSFKDKNYHMENNMQFNF